MSLTRQSTVTLSNGVAMPRLGLGVFKAKEGREVVQAVQWALEAGYRSVDTAAVYRNEAGVGRAIRASNVPREALFITTKVWNGAQRQGRTHKAFDKSLRELRLDYVDLYLVHWPVAGHYKETWRVLESIYKSGRARAIGVSNFMIEHLQELLAVADVAPMVNQIEFHPRLQSPQLLAFCREHRIQVEAWSPLMRGDVLNIEELQAIGRRYDKNAIQVTLRWMLQREIVTIPKSTKRQRIVNNADLFDFVLTETEMAQIDSLDHGRRIGPDPYRFNF